MIKTIDDKTQRKEILSMEIVKTMHGPRYTVVSIVITFKLKDGEWVEESRDKKPITLPMFNYDAEGHKRCKRALHKLRDRQKEEARNVG